MEIHIPKYLDENITTSLPIDVDYIIQIGCGWHFSPSAEWQRREDMISRIQKN